MSSSSSSPPPSSSASLQQITDIVRDITLWKRKKVMSASVVVVVSAMWVLLEIYKFHFLTILCWAALVLVTSLFLWANLLRLFSKEPPSLSGLGVSEERAIEAANSIRVIVEEGVKLMFKIATKEQVFSSLGAVLALWFLSYIGSLIDFPSLLCLGTLMGMTIPPIYVRYEENLRRYGERLRVQARRVYDMIDEKLIKKIQSKFIQDQTKEKKLD